MVGNTFEERIFRWTITILCSRISSHFFSNEILYSSLAHIVVIIAYFNENTRKYQQILPTYDSQAWWWITNKMSEATKESKQMQWVEWGLNAPPPYGAKAQKISIFSNKNNKECLIQVKKKLLRTLNICS